MNILIYIRFVKGSKHSDVDYIRWLTEFFKHVNNNVVVYCDEKVKSMIEATPADLSKVLIKLDFATPFDIPCLSKYESEYRGRQHAIDPERAIHAPELYAIWNGKNCLVKYVTESNVRIS